MKWDRLNRHFMRHLQKLHWERSIPFIIKAPLSDKNSNNRRKIEAFERLEAVRKENKGEIDY